MIMQQSLFLSLSKFGEMGRLSFFADPEPSIKPLMDAVAGKWLLVPWSRLSGEVVGFGETVFYLTPLQKVNASHNKGDIGWWFGRGLGSDEHLFGSGSGIHCRSVWGEANSSQVVRGASWATSRCCRVGGCSKIQRTTSSSRHSMGM